MVNTDSNTVISSCHWFISAMFEVNEIRESVSCDSYYSERIECFSSNGQKAGVAGSAMSKQLSSS